MLSSDRTLPVGTADGDQASDQRSRHADELDDGADDGARAASPQKVVRSGATDQAAEHEPAEDEEP